ncbi:hypothetical protein [Thiobacillus denitrificans]|uniref:hypothetical protein n=1 Tax=Thiobacillus denitrificans TaxID=36861 RepID=UPI000380D75E|nr:hypothetical protein [Thiobacillus denitrificans]
MIEFVLNRIAQVWNSLFANKKLLPYERLVLDGWRASIPEKSRLILDTQLDAARFVQRQAAGAKVCFYFRKSLDVPLFQATDPDLHVATVLLQSPDGFKTLQAKVFLHKGRLFSIEFPKRPERYMQQHHMQAHTLRVAGVEKNSTII